MLCDVTWYQPQTPPVFDPRRHSNASGCCDRTRRNKPASPRYSMSLVSDPKSSPLFCLGARNSWKRLLDGQCGIVSVAAGGGSPCQVAATVPVGPSAEGGWDVKDWLDPGVTMFLFFQAGKCLSPLTTANRMTGEWHCFHNMPLQHPKRRSETLDGCPPTINSANER